MPLSFDLTPQKSRLGVLLDHLAEVLLLLVCGTIADCDDYDHIAAWGEAHLDFLARTNGSAS